MNYLHSANISSIFRTLNKSIIFSMLAAALCSESFGALPNSPEKEERGITTKAQKKRIEHMINITGGPEGPVRTKEDENSDTTFIVRDVLPKKSGKVLITELPDPDKFVGYIRADEGSYDITIEEDRRRGRIVRLMLAPTDMILFCDRTLREYCGCSFAFFSDFYEEKTYGRNIMVRGNIGIEYPNADSIFRLSNEALGVQSEVLQKDSYVAEMQIISEIYRRRQVIKWLYREISEKGDIQKAQPEIERIKRSNRLDALDYFTEDALRQSLKAIDKTTSRCKQIDNQFQALLTEDCLFYLQKRIPQILQAESFDDPEDLLSVIEAVRHITECWNISDKSLGKKSLDKAAQCARELCVINRLNQLEEGPYSDKKYIKERILESISNFTNENRKSVWENIIKDPLLKLDPKTIKNELELTDGAIKQKQKEYSDSLKAIKKAVKAIKAPNKQVGTSEPLQLEEYPLKPEDFLKDIIFAVAHSKDEDMKKGRILENFIAYRPIVPIIANQEENSLLQKADDIEKKLKELKTTSEKTSEIKKKKAQSTMKKAKKKASEMMEKEITESQKPAPVKPPRTKKQR